MNRVTFIKAFLICVLFFAGNGYSVVGQSHYPGQHTAKLKMRDQVKLKAYAFDVEAVTLLRSRFTENMEREQKWLLSLPVKSLLHSFRNNAGVFSAYEGGYSPTRGIFPKLAGWESLDCDLRGHTTGHILSGLALMYATTKQEIFKVKGDSLVQGLAEVQAALNQNGYLSAFAQGLIDRTMNGKSVWAPWYTLHKIFAGLTDQYLYCNSDTALLVATKMGAWAYNKLKDVKEVQRAVMLRNEFGGINDAFFNLYAITGDQRFKWLADFFYHNEVLDPLKNKQDNLNPRHANTYIPKLIGLVRNYELEGKGDGLEMADFFWNTVVDHHTFCTGSNSDKEHFFSPDKISEHLTGYTGETCNTYNMLKLTRHLWLNQPKGKYADFYEQALVNHILGQQDTATGMVAYFLPLLPGAHKVYSTPDSSFWCCVGTGFENHAKYGEAIYYHSDDVLYVNLFIPSVLNWKEKDLLLTQESDFPNEGNITFTVNKKPTSAVTLKIRYPYWAGKNAFIKVNGKTVSVKKSVLDGYLSIKRNWKQGDKIEVYYPMELHLVPANDSLEVAAIAYGPVILAGEMGSAGFSGREPHSDPTKHNDYYTYDYKIPSGLVTSLVLNKDNLNKGIEKLVADKAVFKVVKEGITLKPLYNTHRERYVVYWNIKSDKDL